MQNFLNLIDIYGITFNFTTFKKDKSTSSLGGIFSILTGFLSLALFIVFGHPLYSQLNPNVIAQTANLDYYPIYKLSNKEFPIAFRYENEAKLPVSLDGYVYPIVQYIQQKKNLTTNIMITYNNVYLTPKKSSIAILGDEDLANSLAGWDCLDWNDANYTLGGLYDNKNEYIDYFKITLFYCKFDGVKYSNCTDYDKLNDKLNGQRKIYFSMMIPDVSVTPQNAKKPMSVYTTNRISVLTPLLMRVDRYFYSSLQIQQDLGWIFESYVPFAAFSLERRDSDFQMRTVEDYNDPTKTKVLATSVFYCNNKLIQYQVNFIKIQYVLANIGGIIKLITVLFSGIVLYFNKHYRYYNIINENYDFDFDRISKSSMSMSDLGIISTLKKSEFNVINPKVSPLHFIKNENINKLHLKQEGEMKYGEILTRNNFLLTKNERFKIQYHLLIKSLFCGRIFRDSKDKLYLYSEKKIRDKLDILYYLKMMKRFDCFMNLFLNEEQFKCLKYIKREKLSVKNIENFDKHDIIKEDDDNEEIDNIIDHFKRKFETNGLSDIDYKILKYMREE